MQDQRLEWLKPKMDSLFELKASLEAQGKDLNTTIQKGREYRNPRICEKLVEAFDIRQYGSNFSRDQFDPNGWDRKPDSFYGSRMYRKMVERREREKHHHERNKSNHSQSK